MRSIKTFLGICLLSIFAMSVVRGNHDIEGEWTNRRAGVSVQVEKTSHGIKVKRLDRADWIYYESFRGGEYRDQNGNTYILNDEGILEWQSYNGRKKLRFQKNLNPSYRDDHPGLKNRDTYIERNHHYGNSNRHGLEGKWINQSTRQTIVVKERRNKIKVRAARTGWVTFERRRGQRFVDDRGNMYKWQRGSLTYESRNGDFYMRFVPYQ